MVCGWQSGDGRGCICLCGGFKACLDELAGCGVGALASEGSAYGGSFARVGRGHCGYVGGNFLEVAVEVGVILEGEARKVFLIASLDFVWRTLDGFSEALEAAVLSALGLD